MAHPSDRTYFPPLEECLEGEEILLSWELVAPALSDTGGDRLASHAVSKFLKDPYVLSLLKSPSNAFEPPTARSQGDFETKTAAINVTPTPNDKYDIETVKKDAKWLSKCVNINEVAALRVVVVELQSRPHSHLIGPLSSQDVVNVREAAGSGSVLATVDPSSIPDAEASWTIFEKEASRRSRLLTSYLSERRYFMMTADYFLSFLLKGKRPSATAGSVDDDLRQDALAAYGLRKGPDRDGQAAQPLLSTHLEMFSACIRRSQMSIETVFKDADVLSDDLQLDWIRTSLIEAVHCLTLVLQMLNFSCDGFASVSIASRWFQIMGDYRFLDQLWFDNDTLMELASPLKCLVCAISLAILNLDKSIAFLDNELELDDAGEPFIASSEALGVIHQVVMAAAEADLVTAGPVILSWTLLVHRMYVQYQERAERRDQTHLAQIQRAQADFELENQPDDHSENPPYPSLIRRNSAGSIMSIESARYDQFLIKDIKEDWQAIEKVAMAVTAGGRVYDVMVGMAWCAGLGPDAALRPVIGVRIRLLIMGLLKASFPVVGYQSEPVTALIAALSGGQQYWDLTKNTLADPAETVVYHALRDPLLLQFYVRQALNRYPLELLPFASLWRILSTNPCPDGEAEDVIKSLFNAPSLTFRVPSGLREIELVNEDENTDTFQTTEDVPLFPPALSRKRHLNDEKSLSIPAGAEGRFLTDPTADDLRAVILQHEHSTLALLGKRLDANLARETFRPTLSFLDPSEVAEAISLLATLVRTEVLKAASGNAQGATAIEAGLAILQEASRELPPTKDIVSIVCDTFDTVMQDDLAALEEPLMAVLATCMEFLDSALAVSPGRIWSYMARCQLLNTESRAGRLSRLTGSSDMASERFHFLTSSIGFLSSLVDSVRTSAVQRKVGVKFGSRQKTVDSIWLGASDKILSRVAISIAQTAVDVFENTSTWKFPSELHCSRVVRDVVSVMDKLLLYVYSFGDPESPQSLTSCLKPAAAYIIDSFLSSTSAPLRFQPLLASLLVPLDLPDSTLYPRRTQLISERLTTVLGFATSLLRVADYLDKSSATIQTQLFQTATLLARLCAVKHAYRPPVFVLLGTLVGSAGGGSSEPPSLLGYLGPQVSRSFLQILSQFDKPFKRPSQTASVWRLFSAIIKNRQQWMANCLLTGRMPREALDKDNNLTQPSSDSILGAARDTLRSISTISTTEALAVLDFFTAAQNHWPWTIFATQSESSYLDDICQYVGKLDASSVTLRSDPLKACEQARLAAYIVETFAMQLYHLRQIRKEEAFAKDVLQHLDYFLREGVAVSGYNTSLHVNFQKNFANRYPGCSLDELKRTLLSPQDLGNEYYYALNAANEMLSFDTAWIGPRGNGFKAEMQTANLNLSLMDAQIALFHAWEFFLLELAVCLPKNSRIVTTMLQVATQCLLSNQNTQGLQQVFVRIMQARANLSLLLIQRLAELSMLPKDSSQLLNAVWTTITGVEEPFHPEQAQYYRTLLKILYVVLRGSRHTGSSRGEEKPSGSEIAIATQQTVLSILDRVVAQGFRTLVGLIHDPDATVFPGDVVLITAILQACLSLPGMDECQTQILNIMASQDVLHAATSLFSWSDKLADKGDPVYGELSLLFLLELSTLPAVAEQLACDGLLGHLTSANLATHMRRKSVSPVADTIGAQRCYSIWAKAMLPLILNILMALGATIAPEVAFVLKQFPNLLESSVQRFEAPGLSRTSQQSNPRYITLIAVSEIHSLALLTQCLTVLRLNNNRDIPEVPWDTAPLLESVELWLSTPKLLRERLLPMGQREAEWRNMKPRAPGGQVENKLEEKVVSLLEAVRTILSEGSED